MRKKTKPMNGTELVDTIFYTFLMVLGIPVVWMSTRLGDSPILLMVGPILAAGLWILVCNYLFTRWKRRKTK